MADSEIKILLIQRDAELHSSKGGFHQFFMNGVHQRQYLGPGVSKYAQLNKDKLSIKQR